MFHLCFAQCFFCYKDSGIHYHVLIGQYSVGYSPSLYILWTLASVYIVYACIVLCSVLQASIRPALVDCLGVKYINQIKNNIQTKCLYRNSYNYYDSFV